MKTRPALTAMLAASVTLSGFPALAAASEDGADVPVVVGKDGAEFDACAAVGKVSGLDPDGENSLTVRSLPGPHGEERDHLDSATLVWLCDAEGAWQGIVYASGQFQDLGDCRVGSPVPEPEAYRGPCRSGWVDGKFIQLIAG